MESGPLAANLAAADGWISSPPPHTVGSEPVIRISCQQNRVHRCRANRLAPGERQAQKGLSHAWGDTPPWEQVDCTLLPTRGSPRNVLGRNVYGHHCLATVQTGAQETALSLLIALRARTEGFTTVLQGLRVRPVPLLTLVLSPSGLCLKFSGPSLPHLLPHSPTLIHPLGTGWCFPSLGEKVSWLPYREWLPLTYTHELLLASCRL